MPGTSLPVVTAPAPIPPVVQTPPAVAPVNNGTDPRIVTPGGGIRIPADPTAQTPGPVRPPNGIGAPDVGVVGSSVATVNPARPQLGEIIPDSQALLSSMRSIQTHPQSSAASTSPVQASSVTPQPACVPVTFRPDTQRAGTTLVDLTGDGLIVSAVPNSHIQAVFTRSGYSEVSLAQPVRWCIAQTAAREIVQLNNGFANQQAARLVQVNGNWQLMSNEQWTSYQASLVPAAPSVTITKATSDKTKPVRTAAAKNRRPASATSVVNLAKRLASGSKQLVAAGSPALK
jgi:hypothetical protein